MFSGIITHTGLIKRISKNKKNCLIEIRSKMKLDLPYHVPEHA